MEESRQKYLKLREIFNEIIEAEVTKYLKEKQYQLRETEGSESKITFFNIKGMMLSFNKYELIGDGDVGNEEVKQAEGINFLHEAPTFIIPDKSPEGSTFFLHLERPDIKHDDQSYFFEENHNKTAMFCLYGEDMLKDEKFRKVITQIITTIAPERLKEVQQQLQ